MLDCRNSGSYTLSKYFTFGTKIRFFGEPWISSSGRDMECAPGNPNFILYLSQMDEPRQLLKWWKEQRNQTYMLLQAQSKEGPLSEVEEMILHPFTMEQALKQVEFLNKRFGKIGNRKRFQ
jgi:hypothetical protein